MGPSLSLVDQIHSQALAASARYKGAVAELVEILQKVESHRVYMKRGHSSLFAYAVAELGLDENLAYSLITVARKAREIPELKDCLKSGKMTFSNARRVASVLTIQNKEEWIRKASELSNRKLEKEIVKACPQEATRERASYVALDRVRLELGLSEPAMLRLRRAQALLCQSRRRSVSLEETIEMLTREFLRRHDPLEKAKRHQVRNGSSEPEAGLGDAVEPARAGSSGPAEPGAPELVTLPAQGLGPSFGPAKPEASDLVTSRVNRPAYQRRPIPAAVLHQVNLRDQRRCAFVLPDGSRCNQERWLDVHHRIEVSQGGENTVENLMTLCSAHHRYMHLEKFPASC